MMKKGQTSLEFGILAIILLAAFLAMNLYIKRGFQGRWKASVDDFGDQYDPYFTNGVTRYIMQSNADTAVQTVPGVDPVTGQQGFYTTRKDNTRSYERKSGILAVGLFDNGVVIPNAGF
jgi:hypothetical protein